MKITELRGVFKINVGNLRSKKRMIKGGIPFPVNLRFLGDPR
jgi:hypothetical protein